MAEMIKKAAREGYGNALKALGTQHENIVVLDADLAGSTKTAVFGKAFPDRHINCGIAEANMVSVAAGLASLGFKAFVSSFAMFAAGRAFEQIRNSVAYPRLNVKICASHGGITVGEDGASHQCCEDFALMRSIPGMVVLCPSDSNEAEACVRAAYAYDGPVYVRFGRSATPLLHDENHEIMIGKGEQLTDGSDVAIAATGIMVPEALEAAELLKQSGIHARVLNLYSIKPIDQELLLKAARECGKIVTVEEHNIIGGLGEAVCSAVCEQYPVPVKRLGIQDEFGRSGSANDLLEFYGLKSHCIAEAVKSFLSE